jgi:hypothetical protein
VPVSEADKFSNERFPREGGVVVKDIGGKRVRIEHFRLLKVAAPRCVVLTEDQRAIEDLCHTTKPRFQAPVRIETRGSTVIVAPNSEDQFHPRVVRLDGVKEVTLVDRNYARPFIVVGSALVFGTLAFFGAGFAYAELDDSDGFGAAYFAIAAGGLVGTGSLFLTLPLTSKLGEELDP